ncbi:MAG: leucine-rich repeat domain-containing protein [Clostridia bacterium]|nr:leucine-rich repeat domain-containing protein [Clostridia bacterium]
MLTALLCVSLLFSCLFGFASVSFGLSADGFEYSVSGNNATVTAYNGTAVELTVPETFDGYNVTGISVKAFNDCTSLRKITIHKGVTLISSYAFDGCTSLKEINIDSENEKYSSADGVLFNKSQTYLYRYPEGKTETEYVIPDTVSFIGSYAFANAESLRELTIPSSVSGFGDGFAADCKSLISINVTEGNSYFFHPRVFCLTGTKRLFSIIPPPILKLITVFPTQSFQ